MPISGQLAGEAAREAGDDAVELAGLGGEEELLEAGPPDGQVGQPVAGGDVEKLVEELGPEVYLPPPARDRKKFFTFLSGESKSFVWWPPSELPLREVPALLVPGQLEVGPGQNDVRGGGDAEVVELKGEYSLRLVSDATIRKLPGSSRTFRPASPAT